MKKWFPHTALTILFLLMAGQQFAWGHALNLDHSPVEGCTHLCTTHPGDFNFHAVPGNHQDRNVPGWPVEWAAEEVDEEEEASRFHLGSFSLLDGDGHAPRNWALVMDEADPAPVFSTHGILHSGRALALYLTFEVFRL